MKVGIVGCGYVGSTAAYAMVMNGVGREIVMVDLNSARAAAEADDIFHAVPFANPLQVRDGTYEYYGEASNSNIYGGSNSQSRDYGRWSATTTSLTARSNSGKTTTYTLERRNHPKTGDPMLMVDGDAFVTYYQKRPW